MGSYRQAAGGTHYVFADLKALLAAASPRRSGDELAGLAARTDAERVAARYALADVPLQAFLDEALVPYEADEVTRLILDTHDRAAFAPVASLTVGGLRDFLLASATDHAVLTRLAPGLTPEMAAAASKLMRNQDLIAVARKARVVTAFRTTLGLPGRLSTRLQPNHPSDDPRGIAAAILDGLLLGVGDAVHRHQSRNGQRRQCGDAAQHAGRRSASATTCRCRPACSPTSPTRSRRWPAARRSTWYSSRSPAREAANRGFGVDLAVLREARDAALALDRGTVGRNVMYFETGRARPCRPTRITASTSRRLEARAYAVARAFEPLLVNTVVGFIGPEYLYDGKQIIRAGLEDHFCGKLLGLPMGCDVCYTNHAEADQDDMDSADDAADGRRRHLPHLRAGRRRRHAQLPEPVAPRRAAPARDLRRQAGARVRGVARAHGHDRRQRASP